MSKKKIATKLVKKAAKEAGKHLVTNTAASLIPGGYISVKYAYKPAKYLLKGLKKLF